MEKKGKTGTFLKGVKAEMRKVIWPSKKDLTNYTLVVIGISVAVAALVYLIDLGIGALFKLFIK
ncbi:preprotein translocase subunit SecE [Fenollaria sporofastidiosus]|uniref:preprotein translocase subunit SecE n=1 Tax=Fenollaria sporofastidiosus TaxID=2811778 RepID=UPI001C002318|nr:preprotein translocase subunit SecE [Fenollaria sporofastidiosus]